MASGPFDSSSPTSRLAFSLCLTWLTFLLVPGQTYAVSPSAVDPVIAAAGDISCAQGPDGSSTCRDQATSDLLVNRGLSRVLTLGDQQYESGALSAFDSYYDPTWGRVKEITSPSPGNHDPFSSGYATYFGARAPARYYSFDIGAWHLISLDSNNVDATQVSWLDSDLAANAGGKCVLAYWHHARFSSGTTHGNSTRVAPFWTELYEANAEVVLSSHEHNYERFAPQDPSSTFDAERGIRQFVVGTGGKSHYGFGAPAPNSEIRESSTYGVLELTLRPGTYEWQFVPEAGKSFTDSGTGVCHGDGAGYPRPGSATPLRVPLVVAYDRCTASNSAHVAPKLSPGPGGGDPSCAPSLQTSDELTTSTIGKQGAFARFRVVAGDPDTPADEADIVITANATDVRNRSDGTDYVGPVILRALMRITDRANGPGGVAAATVKDTELSVPIDCVATNPPANLGSSCNLVTTADALVPDFTKEGRTAVVSMSSVDLLDAGPDGIVDTGAPGCAPTCGSGDEEIYLDQGVFTP